MRVCVVATAAMISAALCGQAAGQALVNGNFETGDLSGWSVINTSNGAGAPGSVVFMDIDGPGPLPASNAAAFMVGLATFQPNSLGGIEMSQSVNLTAGVQYTFDLDWSAQRLATNPNAEGGIFTIFVDDAVVGSVAAGEVSAPAPKFGHLTAQFTPTTSGQARVGVRIVRPYVPPGDLTSYVDNFTISGGGPAPCYANCDGSTTAPVLNVNDFTCFLNKYAAGDSYANCDGSTTAPILNVNDFTCFLNKYAAGCP